MTYDPNATWGVPPTPPAKPSGNGVKIAAIICGTLVVLAGIAAVGVVVGDNDQERDGVGVVDDDSSDGLLSTDEYDLVVETAWESQSAADQRLVCGQVEVNGVWDTVQAIDAAGSYDMTMENQRAWERLLRAECL